MHDRIKTGLTEQINSSCSFQPTPPTHQLAGALSDLAHNFGMILPPNLVGYIQVWCGWTSSKLIPTWSEPHLMVLPPGNISIIPCQAPRVARVGSSGGGDGYWRAFHKLLGSKYSVWDWKAGLFFALFYSSEYNHLHASIFTKEVVIIVGRHITINVTASKHTHKYPIYFTWPYPLRDHKRIPWQHYEALSKYILVWTKASLENMSLFKHTNTLHKHTCSPLWAFSCSFV